MNFDFVGLGLDERVQSVAMDSEVKLASYLDDLCLYMRVLVLSKKVTTPIEHVQKMG